MAGLGKRGWGLAVAGLLATQAGCMTGQTGMSTITMEKTPPLGTPAPEELPPNQAVLACLKVAQSQEKNGNEEAAVPQYEKVLTLDPENLQAARRLAVLYDNVCEFNKADNLYRKVARARPRDADLFCDWGYSYYLRQNWNEAVKTYLHALEINPQHQRARCNLGLALGQMERYGEAQRAFQDAHLTEAEVHCNLAFIYLTKGKFDDARRECQTACRLDRFCNQAQELLAHMDGKPSPSGELGPDKTGTASARAAGKPAPPRREASVPRAPVAQLSPPTPPGPLPAGIEAPQPVYVSPNGVGWVPVQKPQTPAGMPPPPAAGAPGTVTFD
jgi:Flp pilus assembly protein TadD